MPRRALSVFPCLLALVACAPGNPAGGASPAPAGVASKAPPGGSPSAAPAGGLTPVAISVDGVPVDTGGLWQAWHRKKGSADMIFGQSVGTFPKEASMLLQLSLDEELAGDGEWDTSAVKNANALLRYLKDPVPYALNNWTPRDTKGITFTIKVSGGKLDVSWKGPMPKSGGSATAQVEAVAAGMPITKQF